MTSPVLEVRNLRVEIETRRGLVHAVDGASFALNTGDAFGLVGESGCGKTMTLRAILGLLPSAARVVEGEVLLDGEDLLGLSASEMQQVRGGKVSMIFQEPMTALNPVMRLGAQIAEGPMAHLSQSRRAAHSTAVELMRLVGIPDPERRSQSYPHEFSGGMRQRIMIAIALACRPRVILCDEPTTALDVTIQDQILKLLVSLCREFGVSLVFVTHDLAVIAQTCQSVAVMYAGQVVETGTVEEVFRQPRHPYTLGLLRSVPDFERITDALEPISGSPPDMIAPPAGCRFHPRCPFVQNDCRSGDFPLRPVAGGRLTACIHDDRCAESVRMHPVIDGA
jgi:peptide/nickel transport system ATP-binding protein/oligopeptide transport system ATP-binding protein